MLSVKKLENDMAYKCVVLQSAKQDFEDILWYLIKVLKSPQAAESLLAEYDEAILRLSEQPDICRLCSHPYLASKSYRAYYFKNYVLLYKWMDETVYLSHFFHQRQDYAKLI